MLIKAENTRIKKVFTYPVWIREFRYSLGDLFGFITACAFLCGFYILFMRGCGGIHRLRYGAQAVVAEGPRGAFYPLPVNSTIRVSHGGTCGCVGSITTEDRILNKGETDQIVFTPLTMDHLFGNPDYDARVEGNYYACSVGAGQLRLYYEPRLKWTSIGFASYYQISCHQSAVSCLLSAIEHPDQVKPFVKYPLAKSSIAGGSPFYAWDHNWNNLAKIGPFYPGTRIYQGKLLMAIIKEDHIWYNISLPPRLEYEVQLYQQTLKPSPNDYIWHSVGVITLGKGISGFGYTPHKSPEMLEGDAAMKAFLIDGRKKELEIKTLQIEEELNIKKTQVEHLEKQLKGNNQ